MNKQVKQIIFWVGALIIGAVLGSLHVAAVDSICDFTATVFTRLFKFTAVPAIAVSILTTLAMLGGNKETGKIFRKTITYTLLTTLAASTIAAILPEGNFLQNKIAAASAASTSAASDEEPKS